MPALAGQGDAKGYDLLRANWNCCLKIPMPNPRVRSLNLATAVGIVLFEALRQIRA